MCGSWNARRCKSGESCRRKPAGWNESAVGAARNGAPVITLRHYGLKRADLICRTAAYGIRMHGWRGREGQGDFFPSRLGVTKYCRA